MTVMELISELKATREHFDWKLVGSKQLLRGFRRDGESRMPLDPIRALCLARSGRIFEDGSHVDAGQTIGLSPSDCSDIIDAADNRLQEGSDASMPLDPYKEWLRRQLIFAVGLNSSSNRNTVWNTILTKSLFLL